MHEFNFDFKDVIEEAGDIVVITKAFPYDFPGPEIVYVNKAFSDLTGYTYEEAVGGSPRMLQGEDTDPETKKIIREALVNQHAVRVTVRNYSKQGVGYWLEMSILPLRDRHGKVTHFAAIERDITESKERQIELDEMSRRDSLSGLLNRRAFDEILEHAQSNFDEGGEIFSVIAMDIDHFKAVNDQYGHHSGDKVIRRVADICSKVFNKVGSVARTGGEEFSILVPRKTANEVGLMAEHLRRNIEASVIPTKTGSVKVTVSIGVSQVETIDTKSLEVMVRADTALYSAKHSGRNQVCVYQQGSEVFNTLLPDTVV